MKRFHVHAHVEDLQASIALYSTEEELAALKAQAAAADMTLLDVGAPTASCC